MREKFEHRRLIGDVNITCKYQDDKGHITTRMWAARKEDIVKHIVDIVDRYRDLGYRLTLRQLHYQLVVKNWIINHDTAYKKLGVILDDCRYSGIIDWDSIEDRGRIPHLPYYAEGPTESIVDMRDDFYRINRQQGQDEIVELWTEKDALSGILTMSTEKYHINLCVNKGYTSSSAAYRAYKRIFEYLRVGKLVTILYFGDHDPSGLDMVRDIRDRLYFFMRNGHYAEVFKSVDVDRVLSIRPIGLTMEQIKKYKLPPNPTKLTDTRTAAYVEQFGTTCWEVDALEPTVLTAIVEENIEGIIDIQLYDEMMEKEEKDRAKLTKIIALAKKNKLI